MSRVDKTRTQAFYEIDVDLATNLPKSIKMVILTGVRGADEDKPIANQEHVAFHFDYRMKDFGKVAAFEVPPAARKLLQ